MSEQTSPDASQVSSEARSPWWTSLRLWTVCACVLMVLTVLILPLPSGSACLYFGCADF